MNSTLARDEYQALAASVTRAMAPLLELAARLADGVRSFLAAGQSDPQLREALAKFEQSAREGKALALPSCDSLV